MLHAILCLMPALLLAIVLLARRYPGERALIAMRRERRPDWPHPRSAKPAHRDVLLVAAHGGQLLARALAVRPPPVLGSAS